MVVSSLRHRPSSLLECCGAGWRGRGGWEMRAWCRERCGRCCGPGYRPAVGMMYDVAAVWVSQQGSRLPVLCETVAGPQLYLSLALLFLSLITFTLLPVWQARPSPVLSLPQPVVALS